MRTFIIRARKGTTDWTRVQSDVGESAHIEIIAHVIMNAFFISNGFRKDAEVYIVLDSAKDFPRTIHLSGTEGLSITGFHEAAGLQLIEKALKESVGLKKDERRPIMPGLIIHGFGFEKLVSDLLVTRTLYLLAPKGEDIRETQLDPHPVFILSDHIPMPSNLLKSFTRRGLKTISLGKTMLFASQCVILLNDALDRA
jgi:tRNA (pseudouridine54-N1)-methyltransferase